MFRIHLIVTGNLKERYWREAAAEYEKRLSAFARLTVSELKESRLSENPGPAEIATALEKEADAILSLLSPHAFVVALCVEGKMLSSEELAATLSQIMREEGELTLIIGSSHGLSPRVKERADLRLSFSRLTFPHQMMRILTLEAVYRALTILAGRKYHK